MWVGVGSGWLMFGGVGEGHVFQSRNLIYPIGNFRSHSADGPSVQQRCTISGFVCLPVLCACNFMSKVAINPFQPLYSVFVGSNYR